MHVSLCCIYFYCPYLSFFRGSNDRFLGVMEIEFIFCRQEFLNLLALFRNQYLLSHKYWTLVAMHFHAHFKNLIRRQFPIFGQLSGSSMDNQNLILYSYSAHSDGSTLVSSRYNLRNIFIVLFLFDISTWINMFFFSRLSL